MQQRVLYVLPLLVVTESGAAHPKARVDLVDAPVLVFAAAFIFGVILRARRSLSSVLDVMSRAMTQCVARIRY